IDPLYGWKHFTLEDMLKEGERRAQASASQPKLQPGDEQMLKELSAVCRTAAAVLGDPARYSSPWPGIGPQPPGGKDRMAEPEYFFSEDGTLAFLLVRPLKEKGSFTKAQKSIDAMRTLVADVGSRHPQLQIGLTGLPVLENDEIEASQHDSNMASWL